MLPILPFLPIVMLASGLVEDQRRFDDYPSTRIDYYPVAGTTAQELRTAMYRLGPSKGGREHANARAHYTFDFTYTERGPMPCNATIRLTTRVEFPRHTNPASMPPALRREWTRYIRDLEHHELGHIELAYAALPKLKAAIESGSCRSAGSRTTRVDTELRRAQEAFDQNPANRVTTLGDGD